MKEFKSDSTSALSRFGRDKRERVTTATTERVERSPRPQREAGGEERSSYGEKPPRRSYNPNFTNDNRPSGDRKPHSSYGDKPTYGSKPSYGNKPGYGNKPSFGDKPAYGAKPAYGERKFENRRSEESGETRGGGDKPAYGNKPSFGSKPYGAKPAYGNKPYGSKPAYGERKFENRRSEESGERSYGDKPSYGSKPSYGNKPGYGNKPSSGDKPAYGERKFENRRSEEGGERSYGDKPAYGSKPSFGSKPAYGSKPYGSKPAYGERKFENRRSEEGGERSYGDKPAYGSKPSFGSKPAYGDRKPGPKKFGFKPQRAAGDAPAAYPRYNPNAQIGEIRLNRFLAQSGLCSRREADDLITAGVVAVNGVVVTELGTKVMQSDEVKFNDSRVQGEKKVYLVMNKPKGFVTTLEDPHATKTVMDLVRDACSERIYPVGRLDKNSLGLLLFTNDGDLTKQLTHPSYKKKKIYQVSLDKPLTRADMDSIAGGITLEDGEIYADEVSYVKENKQEIGIEIHSGRNRIVRRMFEHLGYVVTKLDRVYYAGLTKKNLNRGAWRFLTNEEVQRLKSGQYE